MNFFHRIILTNKLEIFKNEYFYNVILTNKGNFPKWGQFQKKFPFIFLIKVFIKY